MQARMLALLIRFKEDEYRKLVTLHKRFDQEPDLFQLYRDLGILFALQDELFESILPRILRRLSFAAPRQMVVEDLPGRSRINWERTLDATLNERPGEPPLQVHGRQSLRNFATAENLLTVVTLLEYWADVHRILQSDIVGISDEALRHPLNTILERCNRELAFPQLAGLRNAAQHILDSGEEEIEVLEQRVASGAIPGGNSAYDDLIAWRHRYRSLQLLSRLSATAATETLGVDPRRDNRLYQLWIVFELVDLLIRSGRLERGTVLPDVVRFRWGDGADTRRYELRHDQGIVDQPEVWRSEPPNARVPGVRPDYYIRRLDPPETTVTIDRDVTWREPGVVWDAKYYREHDTNSVPSGPVKRMLADLALTGERYGALLFAFLRAETIATETEVVGSPVIQRLLPSGATNQILDPSMQIEVMALSPGKPSKEIHKFLTQLLDELHRRLHEPIIPACHGVFLDMYSAAQQTLVDRWGASLTTKEADLLVCPKPHIGPWRTDIVSLSQHCCQDARVCHIMGQPGIHPPLRIPRTAGDLEASVKTLRSWLQKHVPVNSEDADAEQARKSMLDSIGELTEQYLELTGDDTTQTELTLREWVFGKYWSEVSHTRGLSRLAQQMLISGEYVWSKFQKSSVKDWAACAVQYTRAIELEIHRRLYDACHSQLVSGRKPIPPERFTIGSVKHLYEERKANTNWSTILEYVVKPSGIDEQTMIQLVYDIEAFRQYRNMVAHTEHVDEELASTIRATVLGTHGQLGLLMRLVSSLEQPTPQPLV